MTINLPNVPLESHSMSLTTSAVDLESYMGGPAQRAARLADKWKLEVGCRKMSYPDANDFVADLAGGLTEKVSFPIPQPGATLGSNTTVTSGSANSNTLNVSSSSGMFKGQFINVVHNGRRYTHQIRGISGNSLTVIPLLKATMTNGDVVVVTEPRIEGYLDGREQKYTVGMVQNMGVAFTIKEA